MPQTISVRVDNELVTATEGQTILEVARAAGEAVGITASGFGAVLGTGRPSSWMSSSSRSMPRLIQISGRN